MNVDNNFLDLTLQARKAQGYADALKPKGTSGTAYKGDDKLQQFLSGYAKKNAALEKQGKADMTTGQYLETVANEDYLGYFGLTKSKDGKIAKDTTPRKHTKDLAHGKTGPTQKIELDADHLSVRDLDAKGKETGAGTDLTQTEEDGKVETTGVSADIVKNKKGKKEVVAEKTESEEAAPEDDPMDKKYAELDKKDPKDMTEAELAIATARQDHKDTVENQRKALDASRAKDKPESNESKLDKVESLSNWGAMGKGMKEDIGIIGGLIKYGGNSKEHQKYLAEEATKDAAEDRQKIAERSKEDQNSTWTKFKNVFRSSPETLKKEADAKDEKAATIKADLFDKFEAEEAAKKEKEAKKAGKTGSTATSAPKTEEDYQKNEGDTVDKRTAEIRAQRLKEKEATRTKAATTAPTEGVAPATQAPTPTTAATPAPEYVVPEENKAYNAPNLTQEQRERMKKDEAERLALAPNNGAAADF